VSDEVPRAKFRIVEIVKGQSILSRKPMIETVYFGDAKQGKKFLITGVGPENLQWSTPLSLTDRAQAYILKLGKIAKAGSERLEFFQEYLEDQDDLLARDSYDEFAKAPYEAVHALKPKMMHDQLISWIKDANVPTSRRRLYFTMLGVCGTKGDVATLETYVKSSDRREKAGLDALIACYLMLNGPDGVPLVEDLYLKNRNAEYGDHGFAFSWQRCARDRKGSHRAGATPYARSPQPGGPGDSRSGQVGRLVEHGQARKTLQGSGRKNQLG